LSNCLTQIALTQEELTGTNGSFKNIKLVWLTVFRLVQVAGTRVANTPARGSGKYNRSVKQRSKRDAVVSSKSESPNSLTPAYDHPWRTDGKKINGKPVLNTLSTE